jgi:hypothetical protein
MHPCNFFYNPGSGVMTAGTIIAHRLLVEVDMTGIAIGLNFRKFKTAVTALAIQ